MKNKLRIKYNCVTLSEKNGLEFLRTLESILMGEAIYQTLIGNILDYREENEEDQSFRNIL